jgi:alpha-beta hydrolase superfamily lysophospholipase
VPVERLDLDVSAAAPPGCRRLAADLHWPDGLEPGRGASGPVRLVVCLPGGGMGRGYFDLAVPSEPGGWSMARALVERGLAVLTLDHPAVGDSDVPDDPWMLTAPVVAAVDAAAVARVQDGLRAGSLVDGLDARPDLVTVGCGHSMGGLLAVHQQAGHRSYDALALLGFAGSGLPSQLQPGELTYAGDPEGAAAAIRDLTAARFGRPLAAGTTAASPYLLAVPVPDAAVAAIAACGSSLLTQCGLLSMIPGASGPALEAVDVPVFVGVGEHDITTGDPRLVPAELPGSDDLTLFVLRGAGHNHNVAPTRARLWDRLATWVLGL